MKGVPTVVRGIERDRIVKAKRDDRGKNLLRQRVCAHSRLEPTTRHQSFNNALEKAGVANKYVRILETTKVLLTDEERMEELTEADITTCSCLSIPRNEELI